MRRLARILLALMFAGAAFPMVSDAAEAVPTGIAHAVNAGTQSQVPCTVTQINPEYCAAIQALEVALRATGLSNTAAGAVVIDFMEEASTPPLPTIEDMADQLCDGHPEAGAKLYAKGISCPAFMAEWAAEIYDAILRDSALINAVEGLLGDPNLTVDEEKQAELCLLWGIYCGAGPVADAETWSNLLGFPAYSGPLNLWSGRPAGQDTQVFGIPASSSWLNTWQSLGKIHNPSYSQYWTEYQVRFILTGSTYQGQMRVCNEQGCNNGVSITANYGPVLDNGTWLVAIAHPQSQWCATGTYRFVAWQGGGPALYHQSMGGVCTWEGLGNGQAVFSNRGTRQAEVYVQTYGDAKSDGDLQTLISGFSTQWNVDVLNGDYEVPSPWTDPESDTDVHRTPPVGVPSTDPSIVAPPAVDPAPEYEPNTPIESPANETEEQTNKIGGFFDSLANAIGSGFSWLLDGLLGILRYLGDLLKWLGNGIMDLLRYLGQLLNIVIDWLKLIRDAIVDLGELVGSLLSRILGALGTVVEAIVHAIGALGANLGTWLGNVVHAILDLPELIASAIEAALETLFIPQDNAFDFSDQTEGFADSPIGGLSATVTAVPTAFGNLNPSCNGPVGPEAYGSQADLCAWSEAGLDFSSGGTMPGLMMRVLQAITWLAVAVRILRSLPWAKGRDAGEPVA
jgi:hypothetical protein